ncbi:MAG: hypothetical protein ABSA84_01070 [Gammaproteobacteria bacterium]
MNKLVARLNILNKIWNDQVNCQANQKILKRKQLLGLMKLRYKKRLLTRLRKKRYIKQQLLRNHIIATMRRTHWY